MQQGFMLLILAAACGGLMAILPTIADVRGAGPGSEIAHDLHTGLFIGAVAIVALAGLASFEDRNPKHLLMAAVAVSAVVGAYEWVLRTQGVTL